MLQRKVSSSIGGDSIIKSFYLLLLRIESKKATDFQVETSEKNSKNGGKDYINLAPRSELPAEFREQEKEKVKHKWQASEINAMQKLLG